MANATAPIGALGQLRRALGGQKATLVWDGLPAHRSRVMRAWLGRQRSWLVVEPEARVRGRVQLVPEQPVSVEPPERP